MRIDGNVGGADRIIRIAIGTVLALAALAGWIGPWGWIGLFLLGTGVFEMCPVHSLIGRSTYVRPPRKVVVRKPARGGSSRG
jgi:hypothetical protein